MTPRAPDGTTLQMRIFRALSTHGEMSSRAIASLLGERKESCRKGCQYLRDKGYVRKIGATKFVTYVAVRKRKPVVDLRGKPSGCRNHRGATAWGSWLRMMQRKHGGAWRPPVLGATSLEQLWPIGMKTVQGRAA